MLKTIRHRGVLILLTQNCLRILYFFKTTFIKRKWQSTASANNETCGPLCLQPPNEKGLPFTWSSEPQRRFADIFLKQRQHPLLRYSKPWVWVRNPQLPAQHTSAQPTEPKGRWFSGSHDNCVTSQIFKRAWSEWLGRICYLPHAGHKQFSDVVRSHTGISPSPGKRKNKNLI